MTEIQPLHVAAAIFIRDYRVLACRRASHKSAAGLWEFPGGKVELGERSHDALAREIREELGVICEMIETFDLSDTKVGSQVIRLETIICSMDYSKPLESSDHDEFRWVNALEAAELQWASPDLPSVSKLSKFGYLL